MFKHQTRPIAAGILLFAFLLLTCTDDAHAQSFSILSTAPADSAAGVGLDATVRFTFSHALDTSGAEAGAGPIGVLISPEDSLRIDAVTLSEDRRQLTIQAAHTPETDFTWIVTGATSDDSVSIERPYVLRYTTAPEWGAYSVSGFVARIWLTGGGGSGSGSNDGLNAVVALLDAPLTETDDHEFTGFGRIAAAAWLPENGEFEIEHVRSGTYWPVAFIDLDGDGRIEGDDRVGPYGSAEGDSIVVDDADVEGVYMDLFVGGSTSTPNVPGAFNLEEIYPNPTRGAANVAFELDRPGEVRLGIFNLMGQRVLTVISSVRHAPGRHVASFDASALPSGAYVCRLEVDGASGARLFVVSR